MFLTQVSKHFRQYKQSFLRLGFWKKLIIIFTINTIIILIVMDVLMQILFSNVSQNILSISDTEALQYISISNSLVAISNAYSLISAVQIYANFIVQVDSALQYFRNRPTIYKSIQSGTDPYNPPLTNSSSFSLNPRYNTPGIYFYSSQSVFQNDPYLDLILSSMFGNVEAMTIKRMNVIYQSQTNPNDIFARTVPGVINYVIPSAQEITNRMTGLDPGFIQITGIYTDVLTTSTTPVQLLAIRTIQRINGYNILLEIQAYKSAFAIQLTQIYFTPSTQIIFFKILSNSPPQYQLMNVDSYPLNLTPSFATGSYIYTFQNGTTYDSYSIASNQSFSLGQSPFFLNDQTNIGNATVGSFRQVMLTQHEQLTSPSVFMQQFLTKQNSTISIIIYGWSLIILLVTIGLSIVTGNYIFHNLKTLSNKLQEYIKQPDKIHRIIFQFKQLECTGIIRKLIDNMIMILEKIEEKKKIKPPELALRQYPLNIAEKEFSIKHNLGDERRWDQFRALLLQGQIRLRQKYLTNKNQLI